MKATALILITVSLLLASCATGPSPAEIALKEQAVAAGNARARAAIEAENIAWAAASQRNTRESFTDFIGQYPTGPHTSLANEKIFAFELEEASTKVKIGKAVATLERQPLEGKQRFGGSSVTPGGFDIQTGYFTTAIKQYPKDGEVFVIVHWSLQDHVLHFSGKLPVPYIIDANDTIIYGHSKAMFPAEPGRMEGRTYISGESKIEGWKITDAIVYPSFAAVFVSNLFVVPAGKLSDLKINILGKTYPLKLERTF